MLGPLTIPDILIGSLILATIMGVLHVCTRLQENIREQTDRDGNALPSIVALLALTPVLGATYYIIISTDFTFERLFIGSFVGMLVAAGVFVTVEITKAAYNDYIAYKNMNTEQEPEA